MPEQRVWFERRFDLGLPPQAFPDIVERLRGTPIRVVERVRDRDPSVLTSRPDQAWSIQEHIGHLLDLEPLWIGRLDDLLMGRPELREADLQNAATHEANHNNKELGHLLADFQHTRAEWVTRLEDLSTKDLTRTALHPRLRQPMTVVDLCFFVAEHDDHHLAKMTAIVPRTGTA